MPEKRESSVLYLIEDGNHWTVSKLGQCNLQKVSLSHSYFTEFGYQFALFTSIYMFPTFLYARTNFSKFKISTFEIIVWVVWLLPKQYRFATASLSYRKRSSFFFLNFHLKVDGISYEYKAN